MNAFQPRQGMFVVHKVVTERRDGMGHLILNPVNKSELAVCLRFDRSRDAVLDLVGLEVRVNDRYLELIMPAGFASPVIAEFVGPFEILFPDQGEHLNRHIKGRIRTSQPDPIPNNSRPIWELVIEDMTRRDHVGRERYGTPLQANNGRDALRDAYEEALDLAVYLRQAIEERDSILSNEK